MKISLIGWDLAFEAALLINYFLPGLYVFGSNLDCFTSPLWRGLKSAYQLTWPLVATGSYTIMLLFCLDRVQSLRQPFLYHTLDRRQRTRHANLLAAGIAASVAVGSWALEDHRQPIPNAESWTGTSGPIGALLVCRLRNFLPVVCSPETASRWRHLVWQTDRYPACDDNVTYVSAILTTRLLACSVVVGVCLFVASIYLALLYRLVQRKRHRRSQARWADERRSRDASHARVVCLAVLVEAVANVTSFPLLSSLLFVLPVSLRAVVIMVPVWSAFSNLLLTPLLVLVISRSARKALLQLPIFAWLPSRCNDEARLFLAFVSPLSLALLGWFALQTL